MLKRLLPIVSLGALFSLSLLLVPACDPSGSSTDPTPVNQCTAPTKGPTTHNDSITTDETWTADTSPHVLTWDVFVKSGAKLTIEPCAEVLITKDHTLGVRDGTLVAEGTASKPIHIAGKDGAAWMKLEFDAPGTARLAYVTVEGGGGGGINDPMDTSVQVRGDGNMPADPVLFVDHVTVKGSRGLGVVVESLAMFAPGSHDLTVTASGTDKYPYPVAIEEHSMDGLPTGSYTGNKVDEIYLTLAGAGTAGDGLKVDATLHDRGVPYHLAGGFRVAANEKGKLATMTIEPGVTMKFPKGKAFEVEHWTGTDAATGALRAIGTADKPIVFTSAEASPKPGDWMGFWYGNTPDASNVLDHVVVEYAGGSCGCSLASCNALSFWEGGILLTNRPNGAGTFITNTTLRHIAGHGVVEGWQYPNGDPRNQQIDFKATNTFDDLKGCVQTLPGNTTAGGCPNPKPSCQ